MSTLELAHNGHMTAAVLYGPEDLKVETIDIPPLATNDVLVKVEVALDLRHRSKGLEARLSRAHDSPSRGIRTRVGGHD